jgi:hypothetical protein
VDAQFEDLNEPVVVFLVVNAIKDLPSLSVSSCLMATTSNIVIGYVSESDLSGIAPHPRLYKYKIDGGNATLNYATGVYSEFGKLDFFYLVTFKWILFKELFNLGFQVIIYSDLDVAWFADASTEVKSLFLKNADLDLAIQSATLTPTEPRLCMGFVAIRSSMLTEKLIEVCHKNHLNAVLDGQLIGDDDVITEYYLKNAKPPWMYELPQVAFPIGIMMNAYIRDSSVPGLNLPIPFIFHSNYVVGEHNKRLLMRLALQRIDPAQGNNTFTLEFRITLFIKRLRFLGFKVKGLIKRIGL